MNPPSRNTSASTRSATASVVVSQVGSASSPRNRSAANPTSESPNNHCTITTTSNVKAAIKARSTSAGERIAPGAGASMISGFAGADAVPAMRARTLVRVTKFG